MSRQTSASPRVTWRTLREGDWLLIPCSRSDYLPAQVVEPGMTFRVQVFGVVVRGAEEWRRHSGDIPLIMAGTTTDAELLRGRWLPAGRGAVLLPVLRPYHVVWTPDGLVLRDSNDRVVRPGAEADLETYDFQVSVSPVTFTRAAALYREQGAEANLGDIDARLVNARSSLRC